MSGGTWKWKALTTLWQKVLWFIILTPDSLTPRTPILVNLSNSAAAGPTGWVGEDEKNIWWMAFRQNPAIGEWCKANPEKIIYSEVFGQVQSLRYGAGRNDIFFAAFAILDKQTWLDYDACQELIKPFPGLKWCPLVYRGPFDLSVLTPLAELDSLWPKANHMREGIVIVPSHERHDPEIGRVCLKIVSNRYLEKS